MPSDHPARVLPVSIPSIPHGPEGVPVTWYRSAARNIRYAQERGRSFAGSNITETVARLCEAAAAALEGS